jgi:hypothetical protein
VIVVPVAARHQTMSKNVMFVYNHLCAHCMYNGSGIFRAKLDKLYVK